MACPLQPKHRIPSIRSPPGGGSLYHSPPDLCPTRSHLADVCSIPQIWSEPLLQEFSRAPRAPGRLRSGCGRHEVSLRKGNLNLMLTDTWLTFRMQHQRHLPQ